MTEPDANIFDALLREYGLRPTRQRRMICALLFGDGHRHVTAEELRREVERSGGNISLATIYNTLNQFSAAGLLREIKIDRDVTYYDTNNHHHHHFYDTQAGRLIDIDAGQIRLESMPRAPEGRDIERVDVIIRLA